MPAQPWNALEQDWLDRLSPTRRARLAALRVPSDRNASLLGIALLGLGCDRLGLPFAPGALDGAPRTRPVMSGGPSFSISHAGGLVACACAHDGALGLDLEPRGAATSAALRLALGAPERARIDSGDLDPTASWVMTEAVLKAAGAGIESAARVRLGADRAWFDGAEFGLAPVSVGAGHVCWVAHEPRGVRLEVVRHEPREFAPLP